MFDMAATVKRLETQLQKAKDLIHHAADEHERLKGELAKYEELNKVHINSITKLLGEKGCELSAESLACEINCLNQVEYLERALTAEAQLARYEWRSVADGPPEEGQEISIMTDYGLVATAKYRQGEYVRVMSCRRCDGLTIGSVARWMSIPPLPVPIEKPEVGK